MSLILVRVNKEKKYHSIYSDGITIAGESTISSNDSNKIRHCSSDNYDILIGTAGDVQYGTYVRLHFLKELEDNPIVDWQDQDMVRTTLVEIFTKLWHDFCDKKGINYKSDFTATAIVSINGYICVGEMYEDNVIGALTYEDCDNYAIGQEATAARAMLDVGIEPEKVIEAISKINCYVNNNIKAIKGVSYA